MLSPTLDFETYSAAGFEWDAPANKWRALPGARDKGLRTVGAAAYSEHPSTEVLTASYDLCDGRGVRRWRPGQPPPVDLFTHVAAGRPLESHHAMFERLIWTNVCVRLYGWPPLPPLVQRCSMATARTQCLPGGLEDLGDVLRLDVRKDAEGKRLIRKFCIPRDPTKNDPRTRIMPPTDALLAEAQRALSCGLSLSGDPELLDAAEFERLCLYCDRDVQSEQAASADMLPMSPAELAFWQIDQEINWRGIGIDRTGVGDCIAVLDQVLDHYSAECRAITGGLGPSQVTALAGWIGGRMHGPTFRPQYDATIDDDVPF